MAESKKVAKGSKEPKKEPKSQPKKLTIVDASDHETAPKPAHKKKITVIEHAGDTPALSANEEELASIAAAINSHVNEVTAKPAKHSEPKPEPKDEPKPLKVSSEVAKKAATDDDAENSDDSDDSENSDESEEDTSEELVEEPELDDSMTVGEAIEAAKKKPSDEPELEDEESEEDSEDTDADEAPEDKKDAKSSDDESTIDEPEEEKEEDESDDEETPEEPIVPGALLSKHKLDITPIKKSEEEGDEFSDDATSKQVDDIVAKEADELLAREDAELLQRQAPVKKQNALRRAIGDWWVNPATKWGTIVGIFLVLIGIGFTPQSRYLILNTAGVRVATSLTVLNTDTQQPLKNVDVSLDELTATTDEKGVINFSHLKLGKHQLVISKRGYEKIQQTKVLGWGSNPLGQISLSATGTKFGFIVRDALSNKPIDTAEAVSGVFNAQATSDGKVILAIDQNADKDLSVTIKAPEYRDQVMTIKLTDISDKTVRMIPDRKHVFVSKRSGKLDLYKIDADGKNEEILLAATGSERDDMALLPHPTDNYLAFVSTRENKHNKDGYLLSTLYVVNVKTAELTKVVQSERIQLIDWAGNRIVFIAVADGVSAANPARSKLYSYEIGQPGPKTIASANYFNDAVVFKGLIYYAPSSYAIPVSSVKFYKINPDGTNSATALDREVWNIFRSDYDNLQLSVQQDWYGLKNSELPTKLANAPVSPKSRTYRDSPDKKHALWRDDRDGKGVLFSYSTESKKDSEVQSQAGLVAPYYWLSSNTVVYRISDSHETADYIKNIDGGDAKKLRDVMATDVANFYN